MIENATRADVVDQFGPPQQTMQVDGDEFFIYVVAAEGASMPSIRTRFAPAVTDGAAQPNVRSR